MSTFSGYVTVSGEASTFHYEWLQTHAGDYGVDNRILLLFGSLTNRLKYVKSQQARRKMVEAFDKAFKDIDHARSHDTYHNSNVRSELGRPRCLPFTSPVNLMGTPSLSVPIGLDLRGLPVGMQFIGNHLSEKQLLQVGYAWESMNPFRFRIELN